MVSLLMNNLSEENAMNLPLENGNSKRVKYKRRSVSAVRDFPPGCGPDATRVDGNPHETVNGNPLEHVTENLRETLELETERVKIEVGDGSVDRTRTVDEATEGLQTFGDNPLECVSGVPKTNSTQKTTQTDTETGTVKTVLETLAPKLETSEIIHGVTRALPAARDFPSGCGADAPIYNVNPQDTAETEKETGPDTTVFLEGPVAGLETSDMLIGVAGFLETDLQHLETSLPEIESEFSRETANEDMEMVMEMVRELSQVETPALERQESSDREVNPPIMEVESQEAKVTEIKCKEPSTSEESEKAIVISGVENLGGQELEAVLKIEGNSDVMLPLSSEKSIQLPINDVDIPVRISPKKKFAPRKVSAIRDFPPFCGWNAPVPTLEDRVRINSGKSNLIASKNDTECGLLQEATNNVPGSSNHNNGVIDNAFNKTVIFSQKGSHGQKMSEDGVDQGGDSGRVIVQGLMAVSGNPSSLKETPVCNSKKIIVHQQDGSPNRIISDDKLDSQKMSEDHLDSQKMSEDGMDERADSGRVIVHALMVNSCDPSSIKERSVCNSKKIIVHRKDRSPNRKMHGDETDLESGLERAVSGPLLAGEWTSMNPDNLSRNKAKKRNFSGKEKSGSGSEMKKFKNSSSSKKAKKSASVQKNRYEDLYDSVMREDGDFAAELAEQIEDSSVSKEAGNFEVALPPYGPNSTSSHDMRNRVRETLRLFQAICRKILQGEEAKTRGRGQSNLKEKIKRIDLYAANIVRDKGKKVNTGDHIFGAVPGVEVGDEFQYRVELAIVGVHRLFQAGIDYTKYKGDKIVAVSIVASGGYADELDNSDVLIYSGQGGLSGKAKQPEDQKLERGNLALKNSIDVKNYVRVIRGSKEMKASESADARAKTVMTYVYDGLYTVERFWQEEGAHGKLVFKFELRRLPGQPELAWKEVKKSNKSRTREGLCVDDISGGKEIMPICAVNTLDDETPPPFTYVTRMIYPENFDVNLPKGCDCKGGCFDAKRCLCAAKNGEIPYNFNGAIVEVKPLVYECGPSCRCPPSCYNRVSQHGIKFQLEIFKTESRGWGVRSLNSISAGSFICEYTGELLEDREAEKRTGNDEYLFDIGQNYNDCSHRPDADADSNNVTEDVGFTIDAAHCGNVGRFINHSCSPNLYAQNVLYDHEDRRMPHIMLFAAENIPPLKELTYHYNYTVGQVYDSNGEIKMKMCYCGSSECTGRLY
ncbi:uncharacterized protein LOC141670429 [Apium graveolens]|uniref:uncharacterized protein LOC141670429 n=1 Tax=Apium graveolens TaxID=4045 RepID=UPI003D79A628